MDRFLFQKMLGYAKEALDRPGAQLRGILAEKTIIACRDILAEAMPVDLYEAYGKGAMASSPNSRLSVVC